MSEAIIFMRPYESLKQQTAMLAQLIKSKGLTFAVSLSNRMISCNRHRQHKTFSTGIIS